MRWDGPDCLYSAENEQNGSYGVTSRVLISWRDMGDGLETWSMLDIDGESVSETLV